MSLHCLLLTLSALLGTATPAPRGEPIVRWEAPPSFVQGRPYEVAIEIEAPEGGAAVAGWLLTPSAFSVGGQPLAERGEGGGIELPAGFKVTGSIDLAPHLRVSADFQLSYAGGPSSGEPLSVRWLRPAPGGLDFMSLPAEELGRYRVLLSTNRGEILLEFWPDVAPQHVRNFLDLSYTGFYDGTKFHRVIENFMLQGGDPTGTGRGSGPRQLPLEASERPHVRGVLSMARAADPNSASCQFFIMHGVQRDLDGQYSAFGQVASGMETVDAIATTPKNRQGSELSAPIEPQRIVRAQVVLAPEAQPQQKQQQK